MNGITAERYHDISCGHRVYGHENKCANLHGHNYRFFFEVEPEDSLDNIGRVVDFSVIKSTLCEWLEENFDHKMLIWGNDPILESLLKIDPTVVAVPFNPTAENIAKYLVDIVAPAVLNGTGCRLIKCRVEETRKCSATYAK
jgi:6-pyruvoyltetrahydropterin/6-carboxytetrahydropterin synthase